MYNELGIIRKALLYDSALTLKKKKSKMALNPFCDETQLLYGGVTDLDLNLIV